jgi:peroxiredoxin
MEPLQEGAPAPDFTLNWGPEKVVSLSDYRGRRVVLFYYPADWSPVCGDQVTLYQAVLPEIQRLGADLVGISVDGPWCHREFSIQRRLTYPLLSDFEPKGAVSRAYGAYVEPQGFSARTLFVIDESGVVRWSYGSPLNINPGADGILRALESLQVHA